MTSKPDMTIPALTQAYQAKQVTPAEIVAQVRKKIEQHAANPVWIHVLSDKELEPYLTQLEQSDPADKPLYGIPFAIKDNIDVAGIPTTAACPGFSYTPDTSATVVQLLVDAGAIPVGKTNLDQFATGLVGTRSPYGIVKSAFDDTYISGGSSSGSAVAVALNQVCFALGTDTAGSGRVPAAFNNLVGIKPTRGRLSAHGVVPACRTLDCVSVFSHNCIDAGIVYDLLDSHDNQDCYARADRDVQKVFGESMTVGIPADDQLQFFGDDEYRRCFYQYKENLVAQGMQLKEIDFTPFCDAAEMLYQGPWIAERYAAIKQFIETRPDQLHPITLQIIEPAKLKDAVSSFQAAYKLQQLKQSADNVLAGVDMICIPTAGRHYTIDELESEPISYNSNLGYYTNFMNLLDYAAIAIPAGFTSKSMPFGVTLFSAANTDRQLLRVASKLCNESTGFSKTPVNVTGTIDIAVCGAHLSGMPLNAQLTDRKAVCIEQTATAPCYRLYALAGGPPYRPGLILDKEKGSAIEVEVWRMPTRYFGSFMQGIPHPLGIGMIKLINGSEVNGFICEGYATRDATDITAYGGWRGYMASRAN